MKKYLILALLISFMSMSAGFAEDDFMSAEELENMQEQFYESPLSQIPDVKKKKTKYDRQFDIEGVNGNSQNRELSAMPLFKKVRINLTNWYREKDYTRTQKLIEKEKQRQLKLLEKENAELEELGLEPIHIDENQAVENTAELEGGVKEQVVSKEVQLDADKIDFDNKTMDITATGSPVLYFPPQKTTIKAKKMVYNNASNILKAYDDVEVIRDGNVVTGDYMQINMNEENAFMDNINSKISYLSLKSRKGDMDGDKINLYNGTLVSEDNYVLQIQTEMIGGNNLNNMVIDEKDRSSMEDIFGHTPINIKAKEVIVNAKKDHDTITFKKAKFRYGDADLFSIPSLTVHTNKRHNFFEANYPEFGNRSIIGMYAGPGFVFDTPLQGGSTVKLIPFINNKSGIGVGGFLKYKSATNYTDFGYGSSSDTFILRGRQDLDDHLYVQYGANSFNDEWFLGPRMAKYSAELIYKDQTTVPNTIGEGLNLRFSQRAGIGYMHNSDHSYNGEHIKSNNIGTMRARYMAEAAQQVFQLGDVSSRKFLTGSLVLQGSAALYGTGDTQFIGRLGPALHSQYKYWMQDLSFYMSAYQDGSPLQVYDCYRYGHGTVHIREALRLCKYLTVAWSGTFTVTNDAPNGDMMQENAFIFSIGPDDFKFNIGYDWVRETTYVALVIAMNTKGSSLEYDKMVIKNPDRLSQNNKTNDPVLKVFDNPDNLSTDKQKNKQKKMMYAEVIEIEDPDREQI